MNIAALSGSAPTGSCLFVPASFLILTLLGLSCTGTVLAQASASTLGSHEAAVDLTPGGNYGSGTILRIPGRRFTFEIPAGWHATVFEDSELPFLVSDEGKGLGMIFPMAQVTADSVEHELGQPLVLSQGMSFVPTGTLAKTESRFTRSYLSDTSIGRALALLSPTHDCVIYFLMGPENEAGAYEQTLDELAMSTRFVEESDGNRTPGGV